MNTIDKDIEKVNKLWYLLDDVYSTGLVENEERNEYQQSIENVLSELETYKNIAEKLAEELSKHIWLNDKDAILKIYREKVEEDETHS